MNELDLKRARIRSLLNERSLDALLIQRADNFAWATCGASSYVNQAATLGTSSLLITPTEQHLITDNIEAPRLEQEEGLRNQGWEFHVAPWYEAADLIGALTPGKRPAADAPFADALDLSAELAALRAELTPEESTRFHVLGSACARAMDAAIRGIQPGMSEVEIAGD